MLVKSKLKQFARMGYHQKDFFMSEMCGHAERAEDIP